MAGSELVVLFGDKLPEVRRTRIGIRVVGGTKVHAGDVAGLLLALGVADLLDSGLATLSGPSDAHGTLTVRSEPGDLGFLGFSGLIAQRSQTGLDVTALAARILGAQDVVGAEMKLIAIAQGFLEASGAVKATGKKGFRARMGVSTPYEVDDDGAEKLRDDWHRLNQGWETFKSSDSSRYEALIDRCSTSITDCKSTRMSELD